MITFRINFSILVILFLLCVNGICQTTPYQDSILKVVDTNITYEEKCSLYLVLAKSYLAKDEKNEENCLNKAIFNAELTRNRDLILDTYLKAIDQWNEISNQEWRKEKAEMLSNTAMTIAKESNRYDKLAFSHIKKAVILRSKGKLVEALKHNEEAINYAQFTNIDSLRITAELSHGVTLMAKDENLAAFKKLMSALDQAENIKIPDLILNIYSRIGEFYFKIDQKEKSQDFYIKLLNFAKKEKREDYEFSALSSLISLHSFYKESNPAREYLTILKKRSNETKSEIYKHTGTFAEVNLLLNENFKKVPEYVKKNPQILTVLDQWGYKSEKFRVIALTKSINGQRDSAEYYFKLAKSVMPLNSDPYSRLGFNSFYAYHLEKQKDYKSSIKYHEENLKISREVGSLTYQKLFHEILDTFYQKLGMTNSYMTNKLALYTIKDSLDKQKAEKELINIEVEIESKRNERIKAEKEIALQKKHNLQYMGITAGIVSFFILLVLMGKFKVKPWLIRALGFLSFIMLFEFIILLADKEIHHLTHGDPLSILLIKIVLIAILMPIHHWLEHKVIHYLVRHQQVG